MHPIVRRGAVLLAAPALTVTALVAASAPASAADPAPSDAAGAWLEAQLTEGIVHNEQYGFDDVALSADFGFALQAVGGHEDTVAAIVDAVAPRAHDEWYTSTFEGVTTLYAGSLAKTAAFAQATGEDPTDFGGENLLAMLEGTVSAAPPTVGRVQDQNNDFGDTNTFGQAYAAQVLAAAGSSSADEATEFLLDQQCAAGWFRLDFAERNAAEQSCDADPASVADTDATAIAVLTLLSQAGDDDVDAALGAAETWLLDEQRPNGAWGGGPTTEAPNANSTGFAGWALAGLGQTDAAEGAAAWLRAHQVTNVGPCSPYENADQGAVAYDNATRATLSDGGITVALQDQARRATSQALAVLQLAPPAGETHVLDDPEYFQGGTRAEFRVVDAAPGEALCAKRLSARAGTLGYADVAGEAHLKVSVPMRTETNRVRVWSAAGVLDTVELKSLGRATLPVSVKSKRIAGGHQQVVTVRGLEPGEAAEVHITWPRKGSSATGEGAGGPANPHGVFRTTFRVPDRPGTAQVKAYGQFKNRKGATSFTVTR